MKIAVNSTRYFLGAMFILFGLNKFFNFLPLPTPPEASLAFLIAMVNTGFMMPLLGTVYLVSGLLLVANRFVPLALLFLISPLVIINLLHIFLDPSGIAVGAVFLIAELFLAWAYRDSFRGVLASKQNFS